MPLIDSDCAATYKILVLGDTTVGKSSLLRCLTGQGFQLKTRPTVGTDFVRRTFEVDGAVVQLNVWDTAGQQRFHSVTRKHYNGVQGIVLVYDVTDRKSFTHLSFWVDSISKGISNSKNKYDSVPVMLVGNKSDLQDERTVDEVEGKKLASEIMAFDFIETSAKMNQNVFMVFKRLAQYVTECFDPKVMKSYHPYMLRPPEIMEGKRKEYELSKRKKKRRRKKKSKTKQTTNKDEFKYLGTNPVVEYKNSTIPRIDIINSSNEKPEAKGHTDNDGTRGMKISRLKLNVLKKTKRRRKKKTKKRTIGFLWRKLFRRKRNDEHDKQEHKIKQKYDKNENKKKGKDHNEHERTTKHCCVIS